MVDDEGRILDGNYFSHKQTRLLCRLKSSDIEPLQGSQPIYKLYLG